MERLTDKNDDGNYIYPKCFEKCDGFGVSRKCDNCEIEASICEKLGKYEDLEEQGRLIKLPVKDGATVHRECVHIKSTCYHENYKCSECPLTELFCDEFYKAIDRCHEEAYASGCLAGMDLAKAEAEKFGTDINVVSNGWIPCSERLPEESGYYLVTYHNWSDGNFLPKYDDTYVRRLHYQISEHFVGWNYPKNVDDRAENDCHKEVIAWQPLPEPFKEHD